MVIRHALDYAFRTIHDFKLDCSDSNTYWQGLTVLDPVNRCWEFRSHLNGSSFQYFLNTVYYGQAFTGLLFVYWKSRDPVALKHPIEIRPFQLGNCLLNTTLSIVFPQVVYLPSHLTAGLYSYRYFSSDATVAVNLWMVLHLLSKSSSATGGFAIRSCNLLMAPNAVTGNSSIVSDIN